MLLWVSFFELNHIKMQEFEVSWDHSQEPLKKKLFFMF